MVSTTWKTLLEKLGDRGNSAWQQSWQTFVELYRPLLERYVRAVSKTYGHSASDSDVEEVVQDIFIRLSTVMSPSADADGNRGFVLDHAKGRFRSWLYTLTRNKVLDYLKKKRGGAKQLPEGDVIEKSEDEPAEWGRDYQARVLEYALPKIKPSIAPKSWHCFEQYFLKNRKAAEIARDAEVAGLTSNAVCVNALRVLERVRAKCGELMGEIDV